MRIRALKPGFFSNEDLCALSSWHRLCFAGLWLCADRDGRLEDRPKRLKAEIFPYDDLNMDLLLWDLAHAGFVVRYVMNGTPLIAIPTWAKHQHPRADELASRLEPYQTGTERKNGPDVSTFSASRPLDEFHADPMVGQTLTGRAAATETDPSRHSDEPASRQRIGNGDLEVGSGDLEVGVRADRANIRAQDLLDLWNATTTPPIPRCRELTDQRRQKIRARLSKRPDLSVWREAFEAIEQSAFCRGQNDREWLASLDWMIRNDTNVVKVLERAQSRQAVQQKGAHRPFECPHDPRCDGRFQCHQRTQLEAMKAGV